MKRINHANVNASASTSAPPILLSWILAFPLSLPFIICVSAAVLGTFTCADAFVIVTPSRIRVPLSVNIDIGKGGGAIRKVPYQNRNWNWYHSQLEANSNENGGDNKSDNDFNKKNNNAQEAQSTSKSKSKSKSKPNDNAQNRKIENKNSRSQNSNNNKQKQKQKQKQQKGSKKNVKMSSKPTTNKNKPKKKSEPKDKDTKQQQKQPPKNSENILSLLSNPFKAGKKFRQSLDSAFTTLGPGAAAGLSPKQRSIYYLDDRFLESETGPSSSSSFDASDGALAFAQRNPLFSFARIGTGTGTSSAGASPNDDYIPEVLVVGATGAIGRLVVKRMALSGKFRVRVLVRDLYSNTLNLLGTGVTYCQGDLRNVESLEYAVTDVDKIVFCAGPPKVDEDDFGNKLREFAREIRGDHDHDTLLDTSTNADTDLDIDMDFQKLSDTIELRAKLAEQVDDLGMQNVVRAYQNVRHADYGTSQAAKRSLFKFQDREEDFNLFTINIDEELDDVLDLSNTRTRPRTTDTKNDVVASTRKKTGSPRANVDYDDDDYNADDYASTTDDYSIDNYANFNEKAYSQTRATARTAISQVNWMKNKFDHGVFVGKLPVALNGIGSEASIISSRLRSREDPEMGTDLSNGFAGFVCRICADGKAYEAYIRTSEYETNGIEYVFKFQTETKPSKDGNRSSNKFQTVRIPFSKLIPVIRRRVEGADESALGKGFIGKDVKQIGFRVNSLDNVLPDSDPNKKKYKWLNFYIALCYIKVYRSQPEPEFVYLSDARIPPKMKSGLVRHDLKRILSIEEKEIGGALFNEVEAKKVLQNPKDRSGEELYYKYRGEEILKNSGLQYSIIRVPSLNELPSGEFSTVQLKQVRRFDYY